jgi:hypothetical protein
MHALRTPRFQIDECCFEQLYACYASYARGYTAYLDLGGTAWLTRVLKDDGCGECYASTPKLD